MSDVTPRNPRPCSSRVMSIASAIFPNLASSSARNRSSSARCCAVNASRVFSCSLMKSSYISTQFRRAMPSIVPWRTGTNGHTSVTFMRHVSEFAAP